MTEIYHLRELQEFCRGEQTWLLEMIEALVRAESPTTDKAAVDRCGRELAARLERAGAFVSTLPQRDRGDHIRAEFRIEGARDRDASQPSTRPQILLLGHLDTVWAVGQLERMPLTRRDGRLYGPGVFDMKAGIALGTLAVRALRASGRPLRCQVVMLWTTDEEIGSGTSREIIEAEARRSAAVLVLEPSLPGGTLKTARKGCGGYDVTIRGIAAHAGIEPEKGASAVHELAHQILRIDALQDPGAGVSVNVVQISGGVRSNVIPDEAHAHVDVRAATREAAARVEDAFRRLSPVDPRTKIEVRGGFDRPPLERTAAVERLYEQARGVARELGLDLREGSTGGGSDGNFTAALGVPTLDGLGAIGDGAHALHEHVDIDALPDRAALIAGLIASL